MGRYAIIYEGELGSVDNLDNTKEFINNYYFFGKEEASKSKFCPRMNFIMD